MTKSKFTLLDEKWQERWEKAGVFVTDLDDFSRPKYYVLDMFPYPSGQGLHVGHPRGYTASDIVARMKRLQGYNVLHPMGWDAFGLPAEQYAIKTNNHPGHFTKVNIDNFRRQIKSLGFSYDWSKEISTADPAYYKWTQWIFLKFFEHGLAYLDEKPVNYCPELGTVLANEEVIDGKSEVGGFPVIKKMMKQWVLKITDYAETLLHGLDELNWPASTIQMQKNWIGKSLGAMIEFQVEGTLKTFKVFTTRADTLFGATYCCLAPEHPLVLDITSKEQEKDVRDYIEKSGRKSDLERSELNKEKTGVFTGSYARNPINQTLIPIWIADYVLYGYGEGAVMAVPGHDERDYAFAKAHNLPIKQVLEGDISENAMIQDALHINSDFINGLYIEEAKKKITEKLIELKAGSFKTSYRLRDWLFSRQRYWGEPIPVVIMDEDGSILPLKVDDLPLVLPDLKNYKPSGDGQSPLAKNVDWVNVKINGKPGKRETNTMPQWAGSSWYFLRYVDPHNDNELARESRLKHWLPVDLYIGGAEHAVGHLLYARFWNQFLYDQGYVYSHEPFKRLFHQGFILGENNEKMSKSRGNVVNPDEVTNKFGADTLRLYEMFLGPLDASLPWNEQGLEGIRRFLDRVERLYIDEDNRKKVRLENDGQLDYVYHYTVKKVSEDIDNLQFNTAIAQMMIFVNEAYKANSLYQKYLDGFLILLSVFAPHTSEEIHEVIGGKALLAQANWPEYLPEKLIQQTREIGVQINGKLRGTITVALEDDEEAIQKKAFQQENIRRYLDGATVKKVIIVKNKIVNIVI